MEQLFILKLVVSIVIVIGLSLIAENVSPRIAGILSGCPTGSAISLFFFGLEISPEFAGESALFNMYGTSACLVFLYVYYLVSLYAKRFVILQSSIAATIAFLIAIYLLQLVPNNPYFSVIFSVSMVFVFTLLFKKVANVSVTKKVKPTLFQMGMRGGSAAVIILGITAIASLVGPKWAGLISAFPTTLFPLMLIMHFTYSKAHVHSIIKNVPLGTFSLLLYSLVVSFAYPAYGVFMGTAVAYTAVFGYLIVLQFLNKSQKKKALKVKMR